MFILTLAHYPARRLMDALQLGRVGASPTVARYQRPYDGGQRDHSRGIRNHPRCPLWIWLAVQFPEGMFAVWHWEYPNGARVYTDGCFAPAGDAAPVPVIDFRHDLRWVGDDGSPVDYGRDGDDVAGLAGRVELVLEGGRTVGIDGQEVGPSGTGQSAAASTR